MNAAGSARKWFSVWLRASAALGGNVPLEKAAPHTTPHSPQGPRIWAAGFGKEARAQGVGASPYGWGRPPERRQGNAPPLPARRAQAPQRPLAGVALPRAERRGGGRGRGGPRRGGSGEAGGAAPEESASGRGGCRLAPPRGTEREASAPATETPAAGGASTSEEGGRSERRAAPGPAWGWGGEPRPRRGPPPVLCPRAPPGPGERLRRSGARAPRGGEERGREPGASSTALWRAGDAVPAYAAGRCG